MHDTLSPEALRYLERLRTAVSDLSEGDDIVSGVAEELRGLDEAAARERIVMLGDPTYIAAAARAAAATDAVRDRNAQGTSPAPSAADLSARREPAGPAAPGLTAGTKTAWILIPTLTMIVGTVLLPFLGPMVGTVLLWSSPVFSRRAKVGATLAPLAAGLAAYLFGVLVPAPEGWVASPLAPPIFSVAQAVPIAWMIAVAVAGAWLLIVRMRQPR